MSKAPSRDEKVTNLMFNYTMIMMALLEGAFSALATGMTEVMTKAAEGMAEAMGGEEAKESVKTQAHVAPGQVAGKVGDMFKKIRDEVSADFTPDDPKFKAFIKDPSFDEGVRIVEKFKFKVAPLTEKISDSDLSGYLSMLQNGDPEFGKMMSELGEWQKKTPHMSKDHPE